MIERLGGATQIGLDVGARTLRGARVESGGRATARVHEPLVKDSTARLLDQLEAAVRSLDGDAPARAVGIAVPGIVLGPRVSLCANLPVINGIALAEEMTRRLGRPTFLENNANAAALAEAWQGAGRGGQSLLFVAIGTGIGAGVVLDGRVWPGRGGYAGEIGHLQVDPDGEPCGCGSRGCLQTIAGADGWTRRARQAIIRRESTLRGTALDAKAIAEAARAGDAVAVEVVTAAARALGLGIAAALSVLNLSRVVIGGGVAAAGPFLLDAIAEESRRRVLPQIAAECSFHLSELGEDAAVLGAARVAKVAVLSAGSS